MEKSAASPSIVMARLDPAIQRHTEFIGLFLDGPVKPGHDKLSFWATAPIYSPHSFAGITRSAVPAL
jgi:hypothetical protein